MSLLARWRTLLGRWTSLLEPGRKLQESSAPALRPRRPIQARWRRLLAQWLGSIPRRWRGRSATTQTRQTTLNTHYDELSALCGIGQGLFKQTDVSKYDDDVIDPTVHSDGPATPPAE